MKLRKKTSSLRKNHKPVLNTNCNRQNTEAQKSPAWNDLGMIYEYTRAFLPVITVDNTKFERKM